jgi:ATP-binding cassette, subfamily C (CFTR/MRP), member 1
MTSTIFLLTSTYAIRLATLAASLSMFRAALASVLRSPVSFFDTTPMGMFTLVNLDTFLTNIYIGRIMSRFSKDQDTLDTQISMTLYQVGSIFALNLAISQYFGLVPLHIQFRYWNGKCL